MCISGEAVRAVWRQVDLTADTWKEQTGSFWITEYLSDKANVGADQERKKKNKFNKATREQEIQNNNTRLDLHGREMRNHSHS